MMTTRTFDQMVQDMRKQAVEQGLGTTRSVVAQVKGTHLVVHFYRGEYSTILSRAWQMDDESAVKVLADLLNAAEVEDVSNLLPKSGSVFVEGHF